MNSDSECLPSYLVGLLAYHVNKHQTNYLVDCQAVYKGEILINQAPLQKVVSPRLARQLQTFL